jgi:hypothetical protein
MRLKVDAMSNHSISHGKTLFDIFNMLNPNCYQAFIIQCIIENKKEEALQYCDELVTAINYYKWDAKDISSKYTDALICDSNLEKWQKLSIIYIVSNNIDQCKNAIKDEIKLEKEKSDKRLEYIKRYENKKSLLEELYSLYGFDQSL